MAIFKRGRVYWYHFVFSGEHIQQSTKQGNPRVARQMEAAHRTSLAMGEVGFREKKQVPTLEEFIRNRFEPWAKSQFEHNSPKTWKDWYRCNLRILRSYSALSKKRLDQITSEDLTGFAAYRQSTGLQVSTVNSSLRVLRRVFRMATDWGALESSGPKIQLLKGERHRERVSTAEEQAKYLAACPEPLCSVATLLADTGMRPEECYRLQWESITWVNGRHGTLQVTHGKTAAARRLLPMTARVRVILEARWQAAGSLTEGWVFPAPTRTGHVEPSTFKKRHAWVFETLKNEAAKRDEKPVRPFVLYTFRHTFATRLGESGLDAWTLCRIMGWSHVNVSSRYVHPGQDAVLNALERLQPSGMLTQ
jgi:integrase